jgi:hydrogenase maturation protease
MRTLIAGVGYSNLSDSSIGPMAAAELKKQSWPPHFKIDDLSYGPISVVHNFAEAAPPYERLVLITAADFGAQPPAMRWDRWPGVLPNPEEVQERVVEAATGVIDWKNLLVVLQQLEVLPPEVFVIAVQPVKTDFGMELSPGMLGLLPEILRLARKLAMDGKPDAMEFGVGQHVQT